MRQDFFISEQPHLTPVDDDCLDAYEWRTVSVLPSADPRERRRKIGLPYTYLAARMRCQFIGGVVEAVTLKLVIILTLENFESLSSGFGVPSLPNNQLLG